MDPELHRVHAEMDETHWWFRGRRRVIDAVLRLHVTSADGHVLDVGCGAGGLLGILARYGPVVAVEAEPSTALLASERHPDVDVRVGELPGVLADVPPCRLVTGFDVIEHVDDDVELLRAMAETVVSGGVVCVTVPALPLLWSSHDDANGHRRRYTARSLQEALHRAGLQVTHLSYFNTFLFPLIAPARLLERFRGPAEGTDFSRSAGRADRLLEAVFGAERFLVPRFRLRPGVSLIAVAARR